MFETLNSLMFDNVGSKIKKIARIATWVEIFISIIGSIYLAIGGLIDFENYGYFIFLAPIAAVVGIIIAWLSYIVLYAFGDLVESNRFLADNAASQNDSIGTATPSPTQEPSEEPTLLQSVWYCEHCGQKNPDFSHSCKGCGQSRPHTATPSAAPSSVSTPRTSYKCICGTRFYGAVCPNCSRPAPQTGQAQDMSYCEQCGQRFRGNKCPSCGAPTR